jgi:hypothetical protein
VRRLARSCALGSTDTALAGERFDERGNKAPGCENVFTGMVFPNVEAGHSYVFGKDGFLGFR